MALMWNPAPPLSFSVYRARVCSMLGATCWRGNGCNYHIWHIRGQVIAISQPVGQFHVLPINAKARLLQRTKERTNERPTRIEQPYYHSDHLGLRQPHKRKELRGLVQTYFS
ncbi:hypothetical protein OH77DRAFT_1416787 [Trametes cingulata]|nr:hypothetical protein OH77DRAFT_1416787 [Trametes cingulata]